MLKRTYESYSRVSTIFWPYRVCRAPFMHSSTKCICKLNYNRISFLFERTEHQFKSWLSYLWPEAKKSKTDPFPLSHLPQKYPSVTGICELKIALSYSCVTLPYDVAWVAVQKDSFGWLHVSWRKYRLDLILSAWWLLYDRGDLAGGWELTKTKLGRN